MSSQAKPQAIEGGCLCEGVRYKITFPPNHNFTESVNTCQCFQCRKQTGSLIFRVHETPLSAITWTSDRTLQRYRATAEAARGFCNACGSLLFWHGEGADHMAVCVGTFDKEVLKQYGRLLTESKTHLYCMDEVPGVTDHLKGQRWKRSNMGESAELMD